MKKTIAALVAVATIAGSLVSVAPAARADGGRIAAGVAGGLIGGAIASQNPYYYGPGYYGPRPYYGGPAYVAVPGYYDCYWQRQRFWDGYGWRIRRVRVCG